MKITVLAFLITFLNLNLSHDRVSDFDNELSDITEKFIREIMNEDECEDLKNDAGDLAEDIEKAIQSENEFTFEEKNALRKLKKEATAIENFIGIVGDCGGNYIISVEDLNIAANRIDFNINLINTKSCVEIITIEINNYIVYLAKNSSKINYSLSYNWKSQNGLTKANGKMGMFKQTIRSIYNNREKPKQKSIVFSNLICSVI
jgi:hypothetical protein